MVETTGLGDRGEREGERGGRRGGGSLPAGGGAEPGLEPRGEMTGIFFLFWPHHVACGNLSFPTDLTCASCNGRAWSPNYWTTREVLTVLEGRQTEGHSKENGAQGVTGRGEWWRDSGYGALTAVQGRPATETWPTGHSHHPHPSPLGASLDRLPPAYPNLLWLPIASQRKPPVL